MLTRKQSIDKGGIMLKFVLVVTFLTIAYAFVGCAHGEDGWNQACADANSSLTAGFQVVTGEMKKQEEAGTAKKYVSCFSAAVESLNTLTSAKKAACENVGPSPDYRVLAAKAISILPSVPPIVRDFQVCLANGGK
jgi:hypothetical protein